MDQKFAKWDRWLDTIHQEVVSLVEHQQIFRKVQDIVKANPEIQEPNAFYRFLANTYGDSSIMGVRRQIKPHRDSISLVGLLEEVIGNPSMLSRKRFVELYRPEMQSEAGCIFDKRFAGTCADHIDPNIVQQDLDELKAHVSTVEAYADKRLVHRDKKQPVIPTFGELNPCIDCLKKLTTNTISKSLYRINRNIYPDPGRCGFLTAPGITKNSGTFYEESSIRIGISIRFCLRRKT